MLLQKERESVVEYGKKLITSGLTKGTGGNVSVLCREKGLFALSPSGMDYFSIAPEQVAVLDLEGNVVDAPCKPSTEHELHRQRTVQPEEEIQGQKVRCRLLPGCDPSGCRDAWLGAGYAAGPHLAGYARQ